MVRVAGLKRRIAAGVAVRAAVRADAARGARADLGRDPRADASGTPRSSATQLVPALAEEGIELVRWAELDRERAEAAASGSSRSGSSRC